MNLATLGALIAEIAERYPDCIFGVVVAGTDKDGVFVAAASSTSDDKIAHELFAMAERKARPGAPSVLYMEGVGIIGSRGAEQ